MFGLVFSLAQNVGFAAQRKGFGRFAHDSLPAIVIASVMFV